MSLIDRAKNIITKPKEEWQVIDGESTTIGAVYTGYVVLLSAIPVIASIIGWGVFGLRVPFLGTVYRPAIGTLVGNGVLRYVLGLVGVYIIALIIDGLAPSFGGTKNTLQAFKVSAYSSTAAWLAGIFALIPAISWLGLLGLYSIYLLYTGLPALMKSPPDKSMGYTVVVIIVAIIVFILVSVIAGAVFSVSAGIRPPGT